MRIINLGNDPRFGGKCNKYHNEEVTVKKIEFKSEKEANRWCELNLMVRGKVITGLERQVKFELIPNQKDENGKVIERAVNYIADFVYTDLKTGAQIVEDTKGAKTKDYIIKRKLMLYMHKIKIKEV